MKRFKCFPILVFVIFNLSGVNAQVKVEREHRIKKNQFPEAAHALIKEKIEGAKRFRYYKETDTSKISYAAKFKKDRLQYSMEFNQSGKLEAIKILIKEVDIPEASWSNITKLLSEKFTKYKIRRIQQQYAIVSVETAETTLKNAFQNLLIPSLLYELMVRGKTQDDRSDFEIVFGSDGDLIKMKESLPANYDHILY